MDDFWDGALAAQLWDPLLEGFIIILAVTILASIICLVLGLVVAIALRSGPRWLSAPLFGVMEFIRNTPLLVQLFFAWFGIALAIGVSDTIFTVPTFSIGGWEIGPLDFGGPFFVGVIVLGIHYSTYTAEVYRAGIDGVPKGQWEAITALSLPKRYGWQHVILPQALRRVIPALGNYIISMFKEVPVLIAIGLADMIYKTQEFQAANFAGAVEGYTIAGLIFLAASYPIAVAMRKLENRLEQQ